MILAAIAALLLGLVAGAARAAQDDDTSLAGGSDLTAQSSVELPQNSRIPPIHYLYITNETDSDVPVVWQSFSPRGITITPELTEMTLAPGQRRVVPFAIEASSEIAPGAYEVKVQFARTDIKPNEAGITQVPAIAAQFQAIVTGDAGEISVRAISAQDGSPVRGTIAVFALSETGAFEIGNAQGSSTTQRVAPGKYEARFLLGDAELAAGQAEVKADERTEITLEVESLFFITSVAEPRYTGDELVAADLTAAIDNQYRPIRGPVKLVCHVLLNEEEVDKVELKEWPKALPKGLSEPKTTYIPSTGWQAGTYTFRFAVETPTFTLDSPDAPEIVVPGPPYLLYLALALLVVLLILLVWWARRKWQENKHPSRR